MIWEKIVLKHNSKQVILLQPAATEKASASKAPYTNETRST